MAAKKKRKPFADLVDELGLDPDIDYEVERGTALESPVPSAPPRKRRLGLGPASSGAGPLFESPTGGQPGARWTVYEGDQEVLSGAVRNRHGRDGRVILEIDASCAARVAELVDDGGPRRPLRLRGADGREADAATLRPFRSIMPLPDDPVTVTFELPE